MQIMRNKNAESITLALRHIFEYLNGVPHTIWFDNDTVLVKIEIEENHIKKRTICDTFQRFKLYYDFQEVFLNVMIKFKSLECITYCSFLNEKGTVEQGVRFMRRNLLVPLPSFDDFDAFNKELLEESKNLLKREHYALKQAIIDLHYEDITELNPLPLTAFEPSSISTKKLWKTYN